jgi:hypothetical protein
VVVVPAWVWRGGPSLRAATLGLVAGIFLSALSYADSGLLLSSLVVLLILTPFYGILMARRMRRFWPGAEELTGADRVAVARAARRGESIGDARLAPAVIEYSDGLRAAYEQARPHRWVIWVVVAAALIAAVVDCFTSPIRSAVASWLFVALLAVELWWWPKEQARLVANAERAAESARQLSQ